MRERLPKQGRIPRRRVPFTEEELALLDDPHLAHAEVVARTGRSRKVIGTSRRARGIRDPERGPQRQWTSDEIDRLVTLHDQPVQEVAAVLGRSVSSIQNQRYLLLKVGRTSPRRRQRR